MGWISKTTKRQISKMKHIMKYLKQFENHNQYYIEIDNDEWDEFETIEMSDSTISKINNMSPFIFTREGDGLEYWHGNSNSSKTLPSDIRFIIIYEGDDEYFYVHTWNLKKDYYYKCDQLEGLKVLLNKIYLNEIS